MSWGFSAALCRVGAEFIQLIPIRSLVNFVCVLLYLLNQAMYCPKEQRFGPRHRCAHVGDAPRGAYNPMGCIL